MPSSNSKFVKIEKKFNNVSESSDDFGNESSSDENSEKKCLKKVVSKKKTFKSIYNKSLSDESSNDESSSDESSDNNTSDEEKSYNKKSNKKYLNKKSYNKNLSNESSNDEKSHDETSSNDDSNNENSNEEVYNEDNPNIKISTDYSCDAKPKSPLCNDLDCEGCNDRSFAGHYRSLSWSDKNGEENPRFVFRGADKNAWFKCNNKKCGHEFIKRIGRVTGPNTKKNGKKSVSWCPYCVGQKLCEENKDEEKDCKRCSEKSFKSNKKRAACWCYERNKLTPRQVPKNSGKKYWFKCDSEECEHYFEAALNHISGDGTWCSYCAGKKICKEEDNCVVCRKRSFAMHPKSKHLITDPKFYEKKEKKNNKNKTGGNKYKETEEIKTINAFEIYFKSGKRYWFKCSELDCGNEYNTSIVHIVADSTGCPVCKNKTEKKLYKFLQKKYGKENVKKGVTYKWCKTEKKYRHIFDFEIKGKHILVELDGPQHFYSNKYFKTTGDGERKKDVYKMGCANEQG